MLGLLSREDDAEWDRWLDASRLVALDARDQRDLAASIGRGAAWRSLLAALEPRPHLRRTRARDLAVDLADTPAIARARAAERRRRAAGAVGKGSLVVACGLALGALVREVATPAPLVLPMVRFEPASSTDPGTLPRIERPFELGVHEITQGTWREVLGEDPATYRENVGNRQGYYCQANYREVSAVGDDLPAVCISWFDAVRFANRVSIREGLAPAYRITLPDGTREPDVAWLEDADGYRLPTLAEWTHAAMDSAPWPFDAGAEPCRFGNFADALSGAPGAASCDDGFALLAPVGSFPPSPRGVHDLYGNIAEWLWDAQVDGARGLAGLNFGSVIDPLPGQPVQSAAAPSMRSLGVGLRLARNAR